MKKTQKEYKVIDFPPLTEEERAILDEMHSRPASEIDCSDIPNSSPDADCGLYYIHSLKMPKTDIHTRIDNDNLEWLKRGGRGYQTRLNNVIRWARMNNCPLATL